MESDHKNNTSYYPPYDGLDLFLTGLIVTILSVGLFAIGSSIWDRLCVSHSQPKLGTALVINKYFHASYNTTSFYMAGKVMIPQTINHPERFSSEVNLLNEKITINGRELFDSTLKEIQVQYVDVTRFDKHVRYEITGWSK
jgi:hypothetical protein